MKKSEHVPLKNIEKKVRHKIKEQNKQSENARNEGRKHWKVDGGGLSSR